MLAQTLLLINGGEITLNRCETLANRLATSEIPDSDPMALFEAWFTEAKASELNDANAMALARV